MNTDPHLERLERLHRRREYLRSTKPFSISPIVNDLLLFLYYAEMKGLDTSISSLVGHCRGSERAIRTHLVSLMDGGWIARLAHDRDKRKSLFRLTPKGVEAAQKYVDFD